MPALFLAIACTVAPAATQTASRLPSAETALSRSIEYHDPQGAWSTQPIELITETRLSERLAAARGWSHRGDRVVIDPASGWFRLRAEKGEDRIELEEAAGFFTARLNGSTEISDADREKHGLGRDRLTVWRDYFSYIYGIPMKLRDPGTRLDPLVRQTELEGRAVLALRVTYPPEVGKDTWYFYLDPTTYALVGCRFYHDEKANDGEYLVFESEVTGAHGMRLPKRRRWHMNRDGEQIATDELLSIDSVARP